VYQTRQCQSNTTLFFIVIAVGIKTSLYLMFVTQTQALINTEIFHVDKGREYIDKLRDYHIHKKYLLHGVIN
jgi:hypothetical protein